jgi:5-methyltetrahydrofolate--homocysteine methyltransferase
MFAVTTGLGNDELCNQFKKDLDDYNAIMTNALADRLAEAFAELLHAEVRQKYWGYSPKEEFSAADLHKIKYRVLRRRGCALFRTFS